MAFDKTKEHEAKILAELAKLGGGNLTEDGIIHEGTRLIVPETMSKKDAVRALLRNIEAEDEEVSFSVQILCRPWDGAAAFERVVKRHFGMMTQVATYSMFGKNPPELRTINVGIDQKLDVPWGKVELPTFPDSTITLTASMHADHGLVFTLVFNGPRKFRSHVQGLFKLVEKEVQENSIYRGKAFDGAEMPNFLDLRGLKREEVIYSDEIVTQLEANIWSLLRYTDQTRKAGLPLKRAVLLEGPYGTGKTLGAMLTAAEAVDAGWTFIYCRPQRDDINATMQTARLYQPSVVFFEDLDEVGDPTNNQDTVSQLLDTFDGMTAKGTEMMVILTTNHAERIHKGMIRPGRLDAVLHIGSLDRNGVHRMILANVPKDLVGSIDVDEVFAAMDGFMPAFVKEAVDRAKRYSLARNGGVIKKLSTQDFVDAANGLRPQLELMEGNKAHEKRDKVATLLKGIAAEAVRDNVIPDFLTSRN